jgi:hypothetical protein
MPRVLPSIARVSTSEEAPMKRMLMLSLLVALLGGCVVVPYGYRDRDNYYYGHRHYYGQGYDRGYAYHDHEHGS